MNIRGNVEFDRAHRLERYKPQQNYPRPIIVKFKNFKDKEFVRQCAPAALSGTPFGTKEQFPSEIESRRKLLYSEANDARQNPNNKVR